MSTVKATNFQHPSSSGVNIQLGSDGSVVLPAGFTGGLGTNVVQTVKNDTASTTSSTFTPITGMSVTITPTSATSKILVVYSINVGTSDGNNPPAIRLMRDSTAISIGTGASNQDISSYGAVGSTSDIAGRVAVFLDSPTTTSATTYSLEWLRTSSATIYLNRRGADTAFITSSSITAIEVAA